MSEEERHAYVQKLVAEAPSIEDAERANARADMCRKLGGLLGKRWPFIWP
jgi:hypothetical protein